jgi:hypothetical protein
MRSRPFALPPSLPSILPFSLPPLPSFGCCSWNLAAAALTRFYQAVAPEAVGKVPKLMALIRQGQPLRRLQRALRKRYHKAPSFRQTVWVHEQVGVR